MNDIIKQLKGYGIFMLIIFIAGLPLLSLITIDVNSEILTKLGDDSTDKIIEFPKNGDTNQDAYITIDKNMTVTQATLELMGVSNGNDEYPTDLYLDVGNDGDTDWAFIGDSYGPMGKQTRFIGNITNKTIDFLNIKKYDVTTKIRLPKNSIVTSSIVMIGSISPYVDNVTVDFGDDGDLEFDWPYELDVTKSIPDFKAELNSLLGPDKATDFQDIYGNEFIDIPVNVTSKSQGIVFLSDMKIRYTYSAVVDTNSHGSNLAAELTEHIPQVAGGTVSIKLAITSGTAGKVWVRCIYIEYSQTDNAPNPKNIPDQHIPEDTAQTVLKVSDYFIDDFTPSEDLAYQIADHTELNVSVTIINELWLRADATVVPDWNGEFQVQVMAIDVRGNFAYSNKFKIYIDALNDEPTPNLQIADFAIKEDSYSIDIDLTSEEYFIDIENETLYYAIEIDPLDTISDEDLKVHFSDQTLIFNISAHNNWYCGDIPIWVYCDDDPEINNLPSGEGNFVYQEFFIDVEPVNDPPYWIADIPDVSIDEDDDLDNWVYLEDYVDDVDDNKSKLYYEIVHETNAENIQVTIDNEHNIDITTITQDYVGSSAVTIEISDMEYRITDTFEITIAAVDDAPTVEITSHEDGSFINGTVAIYGTASDVEYDYVEGVEVQVSNSTFSSGWEAAIGGNIWKYDWNTEDYYDGEYQFSVKAFDGLLYSKVVKYKFIIDNSGFIIPIDVTVNETIGVSITQPQNNSVVKDQVIISGTAFITDPENNVNGNIEKVYIRFIGAATTPWYEAEGTDNWQYNWDTKDVPNGEIAIYVMAVSGEFSSPAQTLGVKVDNPPPVQPPVGNGDETVIFEDDVNSLWIIIIFILIVFIITENVILVALRKRRMEPTGKRETEEERVEPPEEVEQQPPKPPSPKPSPTPEVAPKPKVEAVTVTPKTPTPAVKPVAAEILVAAMKKKPAAPTLTSEFPLEQAYRPEPAQLKILPVPTRKTEEKPKFKAHYCTGCNKPFKVRLPIQPGKIKICPRCGQDNIIIDEPAAPKPTISSPPSPPVEPAIAKPLGPKNET